jgi:hypothetical protein
MFVNRTAELRTLAQRAASRKAELLVIYGRRRVGKSELLRTFLRKRRHVYYLADRRTELEQLDLLSTLLAEYFNDSILAVQPLRSWELVFQYLTKNITRKQPFILVLDEFPYLAEVNPALPSIVQRHWDLYFKKMNVKLILCGSSMSFMEKEVLSHKSPLYGRRTGQLELTPFRYNNVAEMLPTVSAERLVEFYAIFGGIPAYLEFIEPSKSLWKNIEEHIFPSDRFLHNEVNFLLMEELRTPQNYLAILRALAHGKTKLTEIAHATSLETATVAKFFDTLIALRLVRRRVPATEKAHKSRRGSYRIRDHYVRFWFRYVYPHLTYLEEGRYDFVMEKIRETFDSFVGTAFEDVCREYLPQNATYSKRWQSFGAWWSTKAEIDIAAVNDDRELLLGECKWTERPIGRRVYEDLKAKAPLVHGRFTSTSYVLFSKSGFTPELQRMAKSDGARLIALEEMF